MFNLASIINEAISMEKLLRGELESLVYHPVGKDAFRKCIDAQNLSSMGWKFCGARHNADTPVCGIVICNALAVVNKEGRDFVASHEDSAAKHRWPTGVPKAFTKEYKFMYGPDNLLMIKPEDAVVFLFDLEGLGDDYFHFKPRTSAELDAKFKLSKGEITEEAYYKIAQRTHNCMVYPWDIRKSQGHELIEQAAEIRSTIASSIAAAVPAATAGNLLEVKMLGLITKFNLSTGARKDGKPGTNGVGVFTPMWAVWAREWAEKPQSLAGLYGGKNSDGSSIVGSRKALLTKLGVLASPSPTIPTGKEIGLVEQGKKLETTLELTEGTVVPIGIGVETKAETKAEEDSPPWDVDEADPFATPVAEEGETKTSTGPAWIQKLVKPVEPKTRTKTAVEGGLPKKVKTINIADAENFEL